LTIMMRQECRALTALWEEHGAGYMRSFHHLQRSSSVKMFEPNPYMLAILHSRMALLLARKLDRDQGRMLKTQIQQNGILQA
jgi:hypothetical protein